MAVIELTCAYVSRNNVNDVINAFNAIKAGTDAPKIIFEAKQAIKDVDIAFLGYLALCKEKDTRLSIEFNLSHNEYYTGNIGISNDEIKTAHKLVQMGVYAYLLTRQTPFIIRFKNITIDFNFSDDKQFKDGCWLVLSTSFMPLVLVSPNPQSAQFELFFEKKLSAIAGITLHKGALGVTWQASSEDLYILYRQSLLDDADPAQHEKCIIALGIQSFYRALNHAKVLAFYTEPKTPETNDPVKPSIQAGNLKLDSRPYYEYIKGIFEELADKPIIYHFIYSTLLASELLPGKLDSKTVSRFKTVLLSLWHFSKDMAHGLCELAKNIRDHTGDKTGVIAGRILKRDFLSDTSLYTDRGDFFKDYLATLPEQPEVGYNNLKSYFDLHVLDTGTDGIMPTLLRSCTDLLNSPLLHDSVKSLIEEDRQQISNGTFGLTDLLAPDKIIKLNQQCKRSIAHTGLLTFSKLIINNKGILKVTTSNQQAQKETIIVPNISVPFENEPEYGTCFNIILPINTEIKYETHLPHSLHFPTELSSSAIKGMEEIFSFQTVTGNASSINWETGKQFIITCNVNTLSVTGREDEELLWYQFNDTVKDYKIQIPPDTAYLVNANFEQVHINASQLLRFLGQWEMEYPKITLLLCNIPNETYQELKQINEALTKNNKALHFWNDQSPVIIFSYVTDAKQARFYFTDVIIGKTHWDFLHLNKCVRRNHFNSTSIQFENTDSSTKLHAAYTLPHINSIAFFNGNILLPFDLLLKFTDNRSFFEVNASMLLEKEITSFDDRANLRMIELIDKIHGYKVSDSHYRIGSKIHISDFYYAKRVFQNNFFASRFAYLLADDIIKNSGGQQEEGVFSESLTIIGYGLYIDFLLNLLVKFLKKSSLFGNVNINHNLISDDDSMNLLKPEPLHRNIIIIVPIASTFSTAVKIEKNIRDRKKDLKIIQPHYNLLHISNGPESNTVQPIEQELGWQSRNVADKTIKIKAFFEDGEADKIQKYFISLPSMWYKIEDCPYCFPSNGQLEIPVNEKALFESDRKAVNPSFIFDYPCGRPLDSKEAGRKYDLCADMLKYGHVPANNSHMIYSINTEKFLEKNQSAVEEWLSEIKKDEGFKNCFTDTTHTLIVASCHHSNAAFIDLVYRRLFHSSANIIHYEPANDHIQNFELIYGYDIEAAEKILFVDDTIKSGDTFCRLNEFVHHVRSKTLPKNKGIDACIILVNKGTSFTQKIIIDKLVGSQKEIYSFANLHIFSSLTLSQSSILTLEKERYGQLVNDSLLNSLKRYFKSHIDKLQKWHSELTEEQKERRHRHLYFLEATHLVYEFFSRHKQDISRFENFSQFVEFLHKTVKSPVERNDSNEDHILGMQTINISILKTLTQYPFTQYAPLRKIVFRWLMLLLDKHVDLINEEIQNGRLKFNSFQGLKFLIRRSTLLNANYLLSQKMLKTIAALYSDRGLRVVIESIAQLQLGSENQMKEIVNFTIYFSTQIKELIVRNPLRSLKLERQLNSITNGTPGYEHIARILRGENTFAIQKFYETLSKGPGWLKIYQPTDNENTPNKNNAPIEHYLASESAKNPQQFRFIEEFFTETKQDSSDKNISFLNYLWVKNFLDIEQGLTNLSLTKRSQYIFDKVCGIFEASTLSNLIDVGIFLSISDNKNDSFLVYDKNNKGVAELNSSTWNNIKEQYLGTFQTGDSPPLSDYFKTVIELKKNPDIKKWIDLYAMEPGSPVNLEYNFFREGINRLVLLRLDRKSGEKLGLIGIYFTNRDENKLTDSNIIRYLLLLQRGLSEFVECHHFNNEFRDWLIAENTKRLATLSGHGKEMLQEIARDNDEVRDIVIDLEQLQVIILMNKNIMSCNGDKNTIDQFNHFYNINGQSRIDHNYLKSLENMAKGIFKERRIETVLPCDAKVTETSKDFSFEFNQRILNLICYEVFLNAKKNRWHFTDDDELEDDRLPDYDENKITIRATIKKKTAPRQMELLLTNTGPPVDNEIMDKLNHRHNNVKPNDITAGTSLIKMLTWEILKGNVHFASEAIDSSKSNMHIFTVKLLLNEMKGI